MYQKDGTFKSCLKGYTQIINISGYYPDTNSIIPIFMIPVRGKSEYLYDMIFKDIIQIINDEGYKLDNITSNFITDFEKGLQNSVRKNFKKAKIDGCYFHFLKLLWGRAKKWSLYQKQN